METCLFQKKPKFTAKVWGKPHLKTHLTNKKAEANWKRGAAQNIESDWQLMFQVNQLLYRNEIRSVIYTDNLLFAFVLADLDRFRSQTAYQ